jgi:ATP-binding cassette subfamily C protein LapB
MASEAKLPRIDEAVAALVSAASSAAKPRRDPLLDCLVQLARHFELPSSPTVLTAGLPVADDGLTIDIFVRVAERIGLNVERVRAEAGTLSGSDLPALLDLGGSAPLLALAFSSKSTIKVFESATGQVSEIPLSALPSGDGAEALRFSLRASHSTAPNSDDAQSGGWLWRVTNKHWRSYVHVILASTFVNILALAVPLFTMNVYDRVLPNKAVATLWALAIGAAIALIFDVLLRSARAFLVDHTARQLDVEISGLLIERITNTTLQANTPTTGITVQRISEYEFLREFIGSNTVIYFVDFFFAFVFLIVIFGIHPLLALFPLVAIILLIASGLITQRFIAREVSQADASSAQRQSLLVEIIAGLEAIKTIRAEKIFLRRWHDITTVSTNTTHRIKNYSAIAANLSYLLQMLISIVLLLVGAHLFELGLVTTGGIIAAVMLGSRAVAPLGQISLMLSRVRQVVTAYRSLSAIMRLPDEFSDRRAWVDRPIERGDIEFRRAEFAYAAKGRPVLSEFTLKVSRGERIAILGRIGAGKTTIGRILAGLYQLDSGEYLIDGVDIQQYHPQEVRRAINVIGHDTHVFNGTLRQNLLLAHPQASDADLLRVARLSGLEDFVFGHPAGFERPVGERGHLLSSGQRQIVGLARALLNPSKVIFLDDPTSSMDTATERSFVSKLKAGLEPDQTLIVTTHRNAVLSLVSRVVVVDGGRVVADGPVEVVLRRLADASGSGEQR